MDTITFNVKILSGLWTAECIESTNLDHIGEVYDVINPYFKCEQMFGLYPGRKYEAQYNSESKKIELVKCLEPFPTE